MASVVEKVLRAEAEKEANFKSIEVTKAIDVEIDVGNLLAVDPNPIETSDFRSNKNDYLRCLARDGAQLLINKIFQLPIERVDDTVIAKLPDPTTIIPREKPIPKEKQVSKWDQYSRLKGIQNKKKGRMMWDDELQEYRPRWGYKRAMDEERVWAIDVPENLDPNTDMFEKRRTAKKERLAKNELQRLRNIARNMKGKIPGVGLTPTEAPDKDHMSRALSHAKTSTASVGKFTSTLPKEKPAKNMGRKRKFEPNEGDFQAEKKRSLNVLDKVQSKTPTLNVSKAANQLQVAEERERFQANKKGKGGKGSKAGSKGGKKKMVRKNAGKMSKRRAK